MTSLVRLFSPLRGAAAAFFKHDVALRCGEGGLHIVLEERKGGRKSAPAKLEEAPVDKAQQELALMREQLAALLNELPETRQTLRHLVFVEQALTDKGIEALHKLPLDVLKRALDQLEGLVTNWSPVGLANLRSKMAVAVIEREHAPQGETAAWRTAAVVDTGPLAGPPPEPVVVEGNDDVALAAAYAALGTAAPDAGVEPGRTLLEPGSLLAGASPVAAAPHPQTASAEGLLALHER